MENKIIKINASLEELTVDLNWQKINSVKLKKLMIHSEEQNKNNEEKQTDPQENIGQIQLNTPAYLKKDIRIENREKQAGKTVK